MNGPHRSISHRPANLLRPARADRLGFGFRSFVRHGLAMLGFSMLVLVMPAFAVPASGVDLSPGATDPGAPVGVGDQRSDHGRLAAPERVALCRARLGLLERLEVLPLTPNLGVIGWAARRAETERALRRWVLALPAAGPTRWYSNGECEVDVQAPVAALLAELLRLRQDLAADGSETLTEDALRQAAHEWPALWATGRAARVESPDESAPPGWEDLTEADLELTRRAAAADARLALFREAARLKVTNARLLREFLDVSPAIAAAVRDGLEDVTRVRVTLRPDRVATAEVRLRLPDLIDLLLDVYREHYRGETFTPTMFAEMPLLVLQDELNAYGLAVPPPARDAAIEDDELPAGDAHATGDTHAVAAAEVLSANGAADDWLLWSPAWAVLTLRAEANCGGLAGVPPSARAGVPEATCGCRGFGWSALPPAVIAELTRHAAQQRLRVLVHALPLTNGWTVGLLAAERAALRADLEVFLQGARERHTPRVRADGALTAEFDLPLRQLWRLVRSSGPAPSPRTTPPAPPAGIAEPTPATQPAPPTPSHPLDEWLEPEDGPIYG